MIQRLGNLVDLSQGSVGNILSKLQQFITEVIRMVEPVVAQYILLAAMSGAMVVLFGAAYAMLFAWAKIKKDPRFMIIAYFAYFILLIFTVLLAYTLHLSGFWYLIVAVMIIGYFFAPYGIWRLCVGTHESKNSGNKKPENKNGDLKLAI